MASPAQVLANRENAQSSTGPVTAEGKTASSRNATKFGLFSTAACILPGEQEEYATLCARLWQELAPVGAMEEASAGEYVRAVWRLRRCAKAEERLGWRVEWKQIEYNEREQVNLPPSDPSIHASTIAEQAAVDRARAQARNSMRRAMAELEKLRATRSDREISQSDAEEEELQNEPNPAHSEKLQNEPNSAGPADSGNLQNEPKPVAPSPSSRPRDTSALPCPGGSGFNTFTCTYYDHQLRHPGLPAEKMAEPHANAD